MAYKRKKWIKSREKDFVKTEIRRKLGLTQAQLAGIFGISRSAVTMAESGRRSLHRPTHIRLLNCFIQFQQLESGKQSANRSLETRLVLNDEYKKILPDMKEREMDCRNRVKEIKMELEKMKEKARDAEHAIIVFTTAIKSIEEEELTDKNKKMLQGLNLFKQKAYFTLLTCWEPEQAKLQCKMEAIAGEAKALRSYRTKVIREHNPFKNKKLQR